MKRSVGIPLFLACLLVVPKAASGQSTTPRQEPSSSVPTNIHQLFLDDQAERAVGGFAPKYGPDVNSRDAMRRAEAKLLLAAGLLKTAQDFHDAAFIFQHGRDPDDYLLAHILATVAILRGDSSSKWLAAATLDRYLQAIGQKQVFGTQYLSKSYSYSLQHKIDSTAMRSAGAHEEGDTQDPYDGDLVPDSLRSDFCVPDKAAQATESGNLPPGCSR
jgi:hypothetical protein